MKDGTTIGGVRHQFKDTDTGIEVSLVVEFPHFVLIVLLNRIKCIWHVSFLIGYSGLRNIKIIFI